MVESAGQQQTRETTAERRQPKKAAAKSADSRRRVVKRGAKQPRRVAGSGSAGEPKPQPAKGLARCGRKRSGKGTRRPNSRPRSTSLPNLGRRSGCSPAEPYPPPR
jgi:hypothetical protein